MDLDRLDFQSFYNKELPGLCSQVQWWSFCFLDHGYEPLKHPARRKVLKRPHLSSHVLCSSYDLLAKNCNHFCDEFTKRLGVGVVPGEGPLLLNHLLNHLLVEVEIQEAAVLKSFPSH